jgi:hypothetical protein
MYNSSISEENQPVVYDNHNYYAWFNTTLLLLIFYVYEDYFSTNDFYIADAT